MLRGTEKFPRAGCSAEASAAIDEVTGSAGAIGVAVSAAGGADAEELRSDGGGYFPKKFNSRGGSDCAVLKCCRALIVRVVGITKVSSKRSD